jgi:voltage-gated potassium channel
LVWITLWKDFRWWWLSECSGPRLLDYKVKLGNFFILHDFKSKFRVLPTTSKKTLTSKGDGKQSSDFSLRCGIQKQRGDTLFVGRHARKGEPADVTVSTGCIPSQHQSSQDRIRLLTFPSSQLLSNRTSTLATLEEILNMMTYSSDEEDPSCYSNLENEDVAPLPRPSPFGFTRNLSQPQMSYRSGIEDLSRNSNRSARSDRLVGSGHKRGVSDSQAFRAIEFVAPDTPSVYMSASQRRRAMHPEIYLHDHSEYRSSVLRTLFTPKPSEIEDMEQKHSWLYMMLHERSEVWYAEIFKRFISTLIIGDLLAFVISTEPQIYDDYSTFFRLIEGITSSIFLVEYIARVSVCIENKKFADYGPILGRLRWMCTFHAVIDIMATAPFFIYLISGWNLPNFTYLRIFRVLRIMKTEAYSRAFSACYRVIYFNREILSVGILICLFLIVGSSVLLYYCRPQQGDQENGLPFQSIPSTLYLSVLILTGQDSFIRSSEGMPVSPRIVDNMSHSHHHSMTHLMLEVVYQVRCRLDWCTICSNVCYPR